MVYMLTFRRRDYLGSFAVNVPGGGRRSCGVPMVLCHVGMACGENYSAKETSPKRDLEESECTVNIQTKNLNSWIHRTRPLIICMGQARKDNRQ